MIFIYIIKSGTQSGVHTKSGLEHISVIDKHLDKPQVQCKLLEQKLKEISNVEVMFKKKFNRI